MLGYFLVFFFLVTHLNRPAYRDNNEKENLIIEGENGERGLHVGKMEKREGEMVTEVNLVVGVVFWHH